MIGPDDTEAPTRATRKGDIPCAYCSPAPPPSATCYRCFRWQGPPVGARYTGRDPTPTARVAFVDPWPETMRPDGWVPPDDTITLRPLVLSTYEAYDAPDLMVGDLRPFFAGLR